MQDPNTLIQSIFEEDLICKNKDCTTQKVKDVAGFFVKEIKYPINIPISTTKLNKGEKTGFYIDISAQVCIDGTSLLSAKTAKIVSAKIEHYLNRLKSNSDIIDFNDKEILSHYLAKYYDKLSEEIDKIPTIYVSGFLDRSNYLNRYSKDIGELINCINPKFIDLCKKLYKKIGTSVFVLDEVYLLLFAIIRQIAIRQLHDIIPEEEINALKKINEYFTCIFILKNRILYFVHEVSFVKLTVEKQNKISRYVFHCDNGPAFCRYKNKNPEYYFRGRRCPEWVIKVNAKELKKRIRQFFNLSVEQRRIIIDKVGINNVVKSFKTEVIDKKNEYKLLMIKSRFFSDGYGMFLQMKNPSVKTDYHIEGVSNKCQTVDSALRWRNHDCETLPIALT